MAGHFGSRRRVRAPASCPCPGLVPVARPGFAAGVAAGCAAEIATLVRSARAARDRPLRALETVRLALFAAGPAWHDLATSVRRAQSGSQEHRR